MKAEIVNDGRRGDWDAFVLDHPGTISWHVYDWHQVLQKYYGLRFFPIAACEGSEIRGVLPLYYVRTLKSGPALMSIPYFVAGGIVADDDEGRQVLLDRAIELSREMDGIPLTLKQYGVQLTGNLTTDAGYYNRELSLGAGLDEIWNNLDETNRQYIDETRDEQLALGYPSEDFAGFYRTLRRFQHALGTPCASKSWVRLLIESGSYKIALLRARVGDRSSDTGKAIPRFGVVSLYLPQQSRRRALRVPVVLGVDHAAGGRWGEDRSLGAHSR